MDRNPSLLAEVRANPSLYLAPGREVTAKDLSLELITDALCLGAEDARVMQHRDWTIVGASIDWLAEGSRWQPEECFFRLEFIHQYRKNANRAPILLGAFASDVIIFTGNKQSLVLGSGSADDSLSAVVASRFPFPRVVAFRLHAQATLPSAA